MCLTAATFPASSTRGGPVPSLLAAEKAIILGIVQTRWANRPQRAVEGFHAQTLEIFDVPGVAQTRCVSAPSTAPERWWLVAALVLAEALNRPIPWSRHQMGRTARPIVCLISGIVGRRGFGRILGVGVAVCRVPLWTGISGPMPSYPARSMS